MKTFFKILVLLSVAIPALCLAKSKRKDFPAIAKIKITSLDFEWVGTGFFVAHDKVNSGNSNMLVTAFHLIGDVRYISQISVQGPFWRRYSVKAILALDAINDLAVLEVKGYPPKRYYSMDQPLDSSKEVEVAGFPKNRFQHSHGKILPINLKNENVYSFFQPPLGAGSSGSPIFKNNKLIAIHKYPGFTKNSMSAGASVKSLRKLLSKPFLHSAKPELV